MQIEVQGELDETGDPQEFSLVLFPIVDAAKTLHLDRNGLPKVGSKIEPGMILVGRISKTKSWRSDRQPTALEIHALELADVQANYGAMWRNASVYATSETRGIVKSACLTESAIGQKATIELVPVAMRGFTLPADLVDSVSASSEQFPMFRCGT